MSLPDYFTKAAISEAAHSARRASSRDLETLEARVAELERLFAAFNGR